MQIGKITFLFPIFSKLFVMLTRRHKVYLLILIVLTIGFSLIETLGITAIMPFISLASDPELLDSGWYKKIFDYSGAASTESFIITLGIVIIFFYLFRAIYSILLSYFMNRFSIGIHKHLSKRLLNIVLSVSYKVYTQKNTAELMRNITAETGEVSGTTLTALQLCSELFTVIMVYAVIIILNWKMTLILTAILLFLVLLLLSVLVKTSKKQGVIRLESGRKMSRTLMETLKNYKFVKLKGNEQDILRTYGSAIEAHTHSQVVSTVLGVMPKSILESIGFSLLVAAVISIIWLYHDTAKIIPTISMYALALYRILPSIHRMLGNINSIFYAQKTLESVNENLHQPIEIEGASPIEFMRSIRLEDVSFKYLTGGEVLTGISLEINKGEKIAITGESGSGKSTLVDIIIGLSKPISGKIYIDDAALTDDNIRSWRKKIGYIPQSIYLFDGTVADNVAFGSSLDEERIKKALQKANIWDFLTQKEGIYTRVGDGGIQLSGGQQQRIGIARALYDNPEILVLDEATSALDTETEQKIMDEIYNVSAQKTLIVIAHRLSTVERCSRKIRIEQGKITCEKN